MEVMTRYGSDCNLNGSFLSALGGDEGPPSCLSGTSFRTRVPIRKKGQRPIFRGVKRKKDLCNANELLSVRRCSIIPLASHLHLSRRREVLGDECKEEGGLEGSDKTQATANGSINNTPIITHLSVDTSDPVLSCSANERSPSHTGSEYSQILKEELPEECLQDICPPSPLSMHSPLSCPNTKVEMSPRRRSSLPVKNFSNRHTIVLEVHKDWWSTHKRSNAIAPKKKCDGECPICKIKYPFGHKARDVLLDVDMGFFPLYLLKDLQGHDCDETTAFLEVRDCRFQSTIGSADYRLRLDTGSILHNMRMHFFSTKIEQLRKKLRRNPQQQGLMLEVPHELNYIVMQLWPKLAKSEATALVALVPPSDLNLDPKPVSPVSEGGILGFSSARRSWHYHYLDQNLISHGANAPVGAEFDEEEEAKWSGKEIQLLKGFIGLNCSTSGSGSNDSSSDGNKILIGHESTTHEQQPSVEDMREKMEPYGPLTALRCQAHLINDNKVGRASRRTSPTKRSAKNIPCTPQHTAVQQSSPISTSSDLSDGIHNHLQPDDESLIPMSFLSISSAGENQKLRNDGLLWPINTFVTAAKVFNEQTRAKTVDSMKILYARGVEEVMTDRAWGGATPSPCIMKSPTAVIDQYEYERMSLGLHSSPFNARERSLSRDAIMECSSAFVPTSVADPDGDVLKSIVGDIVACFKDTRRTKSKIAVLDSYQSRPSRVSSTEE